MTNININLNKLLHYQTEKSLFQLIIQHAAGLSNNLPQFLVLLKSVHLRKTIPFTKKCISEPFQILLPICHPFGTTLQFQYTYLA